MLNVEEYWREVIPAGPTGRRLRTDLARLRHSQRSEPDCPVPVGIVHEPWLTKGELARCLGFSIRWVELRVREGMPCERFGARLRFQRTLVEKWLKAGVA